MYLALLLLIGLGLNYADASAQTHNIFETEEFKKQTVEENEETALNGKIISVDRRSFVLDYATNQITVETNKITDTPQDAYLPGEYVKVYGEIKRKVGDKQVVEATRIIKYTKDLD
jgi:hypothetical protein